MSLHWLQLFFNLFILLTTMECSENMHTNNWAILVDTSRFWFNYRHASNVLSIYRSVKRLGIPDSRIILMIADNMACNARNPVPGAMFSSAYRPINLYGDDIEVDYRGREVSVENFIRLLTDRVSPSTPPSKRLLSDEHSHVLIYMTGHGGEDFLKFHDENELTSREIADAFEQMWQKRRYKEILFIADTCQAESLSSLIYSPNVLSVASSKTGENSFSHHHDRRIGVYVADRYSYHAMEFLERLHPDSRVSLNDFLRICPYDQCHSHVSVRRDLYRRDPHNVLVTEFFGSIRRVELMKRDLKMLRIRKTNGSASTLSEDIERLKQTNPSVIAPLQNVNHLRYFDAFRV